MDRRARLASIIAVTATLSTGGLAAWATTGALQAANADSTPGKVQLVDDTSRASASGDQTASSESTEPESAAPESADHAGPATAVSPNAPAASPSAAESSSQPEGHSDASPEAPEPDSSPPPSTAPPVVDDPPTTTPGGVNCYGSDDGMTEAQKQAREAACHHGGDDD